MGRQRRRAARALPDDEGRCEYTSNRPMRRRPLTCSPRRSPPILVRCRGTLDVETLRLRLADVRVAEEATVTMPHDQERLHRAVVFIKPPIWGDRR